MGQRNHIGEVWTGDGPIETCGLAKRYGATTAACTPIPGARAQGPSRAHLVQGLDVRHSVRFY
jgi:hypothetical protein